MVLQLNYCKQMNTTASTHSPLPWRVEEGNTIYCSAPGDSWDQHVTEVESALRDESDDANARLIVSAVNSHSLLVEALTRLVNAVQPDNSPVEPYFDEPLKQARALLDSIANPVAS
jgi:hypothetical protein